MTDSYLDDFDILTVDEPGEGSDRLIIATHRQSCTEIVFDVSSVNVVMDHDKLQFVSDLILSSITHNEQGLLEGNNVLVGVVGKTNEGEDYICAIIYKSQNHVTSEVARILDCYPYSVICFKSSSKYYNNSHRIPVGYILQEFAVNVINKTNISNKEVYVSLMTYHPNFSYASEIIQ